MFLNTSEPWSPKDGDYVSQEPTRKETFYERYKKTIDFIIYPAIAGILALLVLIVIDGMSRGA